MLKKKIPFHLALLMTVAAVFISLLTSWIVKKNKSPDVIKDNSIISCNYSSVRLDGYEFVKPLLFGEQQCESEKLIPIKEALENKINNYKQTGVIADASVYLRKLNVGEWISIGDNEKYNPGSLLKVPELITFLKMNEQNPGILDKKIAYPKQFTLPKHANYVSKSIEPGNIYTNRELLNYMIVYSDNNATWLLNQQMDEKIFLKIFTDLGIPKPDLTQKDIPITAKEYSRFLRVLYNASYLGVSGSEYCSELLSRTDFTEGLVSGIPKNVKVAHKFGEAGDSIYQHFSESGIVYLKNSPYILTVMCKGKDYKTLPPFIGDISKTVYQMINAE